MCDIHCRLDIVTLHPSKQRIMEKNSTTTKITTPQVGTPATGVVQAVQATAVYAEGPIRLESKEPILSEEEIDYFFEDTKEPSLKRVRKEEEPMPDRNSAFKRVRKEPSTGEHSSTEKKSIKHPIAKEAKMKEKHVVNDQIEEIDTLHEYHV